MTKALVVSVTIRRARRAGRDRSIMWAVLEG
jgi:hypothetical protein